MNSYVLTRGIEQVGDEVRIKMELFTGDGVFKAMYTVQKNHYENRKLEKECFNSLIHYKEWPENKHLQEKNCSAGQGEFCKECDETPENKHSIHCCCPDCISPPFSK